MRGGLRRWVIPARTYTAGQKVAIVFEYRDRGGDGTATLDWVPPTGASGTIWAGKAPDYQLVTSTDVRRDPGVIVTSTVDYSGVAGNVDPGLGLATTTVTDAGAGKLNLTETATYEAAGSGFFRRTARTLPAGAGSTVAYEHYSGTEAPIAAVCGVSSATLQNGLPKRSTAADPDGAGAQTPIKREYVYDSLGRQAGFREGTGTLSGVSWTCTSFDTRGRQVSVAHPAFGAGSARTVTSNWAVGGNPLVTSSSDPAGTITTTVDLLGRTVTTTDVWSKSTTTTYDQAGRVTSTVNAAGTVGFTYTSGGAVGVVRLNGNVLASTTRNAYDALTGVAYPSGAGNAGNGTAGVFGYDTLGRAASVSWNQAGGALLTSDAVTSRDLLSRVTDYSTDGFSSSGGVEYVYDNAGRLTSATSFRVAPAAGAATVTNGYGFAGSGGCGVATGAGKNFNRTSKTVTPSGGAAKTTSYCYDHADRVTAVNVPVGDPNPHSAFAYDAHGSASTVGAEARAYDSANRHLSTTSGATTVSYGRDAADRVVERKVNGTTQARYSFGGAGDSPALTLDASGMVTGASLGLPGGVLYRWIPATPTASVWSYPNLQGSIVATATQAGVKVGATAVYDPDGNLLVGSLPDNAPGAFDYGWHGGAQRPLEHQAGLIATVEMGARQYDPTLGRFLEVDPIEGGVHNDYSYVADPINQSDLDGLCGFPGIPWHPCPPGRKDEEGWGPWLKGGGQALWKFGKGCVAGIGPGALAGGRAGTLVGRPDIGIVAGGAGGCLVGGFTNLWAPQGYNPLEVVTNTKYMSARFGRTSVK